MAALMATSKKAYAKEHLPGLLLPVLPPHSEPLLTHASRGDPPTLSGSSGSGYDLWGHCSFPLGLGLQDFVGALQ